MPLNPDGRGYLTLNLGGVPGHEIRIADSRLSVKVLQALYYDCAGQTGGFSHIGFRAIIRSNKNHEFTGGFGPILIFRRNWHRLPAYLPSGFFKGKAEDPWQYKMLWYGGELEYHYTVTEKPAFSVRFVPGFPEIMSLAAGIRFKH